MSLNARLVAGLLAVTGAGLLILGAVSALVLRGYLLDRVDAQLEAARKRAVIRLVRPGLPAEGPAPARYVVVGVRPDGEIRVYSGTVLDPSPVLEELRRTDPAALARRAASGGPFDLGGARAVARRDRTGTVVVVAAPLQEIDAAVRRLVLTELVTGAALMAGLALASRWLIARGLAPLDRMAATAQAVATGGDLRARMPVKRPDSEVGRLAVAINVMLDRIAEAFAARARSEQRLRDFAADASHELRTPLTTIQGYAELYRHGALEDLPDAMRRIEEAAGRMNRLVGELLELARLDRDAGLQPAPTDLVALARDAVADAQAVGADHPVTLRAPDELVAEVDQARIRQVLANLLTNVRDHTPPGTAAEVRLARRADEVVLEVEDRGPGMAPQDAARAFDRFHRASRTSGKGTGLGLSIVEAIATAHGGRATLWSAPGKGTRVRIELPCRPRTVARPTGRSSAPPRQGAG
ncbi:sensor histidine kinase [Thermomonospora catenispora]|uniref:sensor histidine kinase n=1 Tax=Thermomonospora catenispora TaxID=2493090 RepID=UPI001120B192|nr:HAMP domain-containing sensor histidine kinase [Thermomonospora catenispora]TNY37400.1 sensor histidine kinase [Thermomonospora catenispora]